MTKEKEQLQELFAKLNGRIAEINRERREEGGLIVPSAVIQLLGQMSLLANEKVSAILKLARTGDLDAFIQMEWVVKDEFKKLLAEQHLIYDEDSVQIWIPPGAKYEELFAFDNVQVQVLDAESVLVSKAVKAPAKNKVLIREAIASGEFATLVDRIIENGGRLEDFA